MIRGLMLVALVASQMPEKENKPKFIDFLPEPPRRKKRSYKRESLLSKFPEVPNE